MSEKNNIHQIEFKFAENLNLLEETEKKILAELRNANASDKVNLCYRGEILEVFNFSRNIQTETWHNIIKIIGVKPIEAKPVTPQQKIDRIYQEILMESEKKTQNSTKITRLNQVKIETDLTQISSEKHQPSMVQKAFK